MKDKKLIVQISKKMIDDFTKACKENEVTKSEIVRDCIRKYIKNNGGSNQR